MLDMALQVLLEPVVSAMGYELVGVERLAQRHSTLVRLYIDRDDGITLSDCERVSHQISGVLDVEDPIRGAYTLEISSPGLDRPLFTPAHFERFTGCRATIRLLRPLQGRRKLTGLLRGLREGKVLLEENGIEYSLPYEQIEKARLVPETKL